MPAQRPATDTHPLWSADRGDGTYRNPIIHADYSDPDLIRVGDDFSMVASSFNCTPGLPVSPQPATSSRPALLVVGDRFVPIGNHFEACPGVWIGAKVGLCCLKPSPHPSNGFVAVDWFRFAPFAGEAEGGER